MICTALAERQHTDPDKSVLTRAGVKLDHPESYVGGSDLEEFEVFVAGILRWLKMNCFLGETSIDMQINYLGTCLAGEVQEWFYRNVEQYDHQVCDWTLETVVQGLQRRFLHTLTHHHASNKFDMVSQGTKTVQEVLNNLKKYATQMIHPPNVYMYLLPWSLHISIVKLKLSITCSDIYATVDSKFHHQTFAWPIFWSLVTTVHSI